MNSIDRDLFFEILGRILPLYSFYGAFKVRKSYTVELRDTGFHGFLLPENQIIPNNEENIEGTKAVADYIKQTFLTLTETEWLANCKSTVASLSEADAFDGSCEALFKLNMFRKSFGAGFLE